MLPELDKAPAFMTHAAWDFATDAPLEDPAGEPDDG